MATERQERAVQLFVENGGKSVSAAMREAGYSDATAKNPKKLTDTETWEQLVDKYLPDKKLAEAHKKLLNANRIEHMVFPLGMEEAGIKKLLNSVSCTPKKISHGEQAIHVWFWSPDQKARASAIDLAYKLKGRLKQTIEHTGDGLFGADALTIKVIDGRVDSQPEATAGA